MLLIKVFHTKKNVICIVVLQSTKDDEITFPHEFFFNFSPVFHQGYHIKKCQKQGLEKCKKRDLQNRGLKGTFKPTANYDYVYIRYVYYRDSYICIYLIYLHLSI